MGPQMKPLRSLINSQVLITGATGFVGQHLVHQLLEQSQAVRILTRGKRYLPLSWANRVEVLHGDLTDPSTLARAVADVTTVYHLAGELREPSLMHTVNVEGTRNLLAACEKSSVRHVVHLSSVGVMGATQVGAVDEDLPCHPLNEYERSKYESETIALEWSTKTGIRVTVIRPTIVFGEGARNASNSMLSWLRAIQAGRFVFFDRLAIANYVYVDDVVHACHLALTSNARGIFIVADSCLLTDFVNAAADLLGVPPPRLFIPARFAAIAAFVMQTIWRGSPLTLSRVRALSNRTRYTSMRIQRDLAWQPINGWRKGLRRTIAWYRERGQL